MVLNDEVLVALEAGVFRQAVRLKDAGLVQGKPCALGAAAPLPRGALGSIQRLLHAARLELGASLQAFEPCDFLAQLSVLFPKPGVLLQSLHQQRLQLFEAKPGYSAGRFGHAQRESKNESVRSPVARTCPDFCSCYQ